MPVYFLKERRKNLPFFPIPCYHTPMAYKNLVKLIHKATGEIYLAPKNKKKLATVKLKLSKFSAKLRKHVLFTEAKK